MNHYYDILLYQTFISYWFLLVLVQTSKSYQSLKYDPAHHYTQIYYLKYKFIFRGFNTNYRVCSFDQLIYLGQYSIFGYLVELHTEFEYFDSSGMTFYICN